MSDVVQISLPPEPRSARQARQFVREALGPDPRLDVAVLLVSELATNAILHARTVFEVRVLPIADRLRCEVADGSTARAVQRNYDVQASTGRGMGLIAALADQWGIDPAGGGKVVWFELL